MRPRPSAVIRASAAGATGTTCRYHAQERHGWPIVFAQYEHIALGHPLMEQMALIGDELPIRAFLHPGDSASAIVPPTLPTPGCRDPPPPVHACDRAANITWERRRATRCPGRRDGRGPGLRALPSGRELRGV